MLTYTLNRKCLHCNKPLADQEHGLQKFCPKENLQDGSIKNCKDEYWSKIRKEEMAPFIAIAYYQREQYENIDLLYKTKGDKVALEDLNQYGVNLYRPIEFKIEGKQYVFYFHKYCIKQLSDKFFKISTHELH